LRCGELLGLGWDDIHLEPAKAHIAWQLQKIKGELRRRPTKTLSSEPPLPLPDITNSHGCKAFQPHLHPAAAQPKVTEAPTRLAAGESWMGSGLLLTTGHGRPIDPRNFQRFFPARATKGEVPVIPVHATRRTCSSLLVARNVHPRVAMTMLRHSKIAVTIDISTQVSSSSTKEALKRLGNEFGEGVP
jgi:integrase